ncbi:MAG: hypothetical protein GWP91_05105 [Rhodobacterales bacterium]|nr:hypothetical protein [Rhodobacterales bacterium]
MNWIHFPLISPLLTATGIKPYIATGPAGNARLRASLLSGTPTSDVAYQGPPLVDFPVIPLQIWGVQYDLDLVIVSDHPRYNMHEYARIQTPEGAVWLAKDALEDGLQQSLIADLDDIKRWMPELPIQRQQSAVQVTDRSTSDWLDLDFAYTNLEGEAVEVHYEGKPPRTYQRWRSGNTMGHSANTVMAALDIPYKSFARKATIRIDGKERSVDKLLGLVKLQVVLAQTQGGLATSQIRLTPSASEEIAFIADYRDQDGGWQTTEWTFTPRENTVEISLNHPFRSLFYTFQRSGDALELSSMHVCQFDVDLPVSRITLSPPLPDLRRKFTGRHRSRYVLDINDQQTQAYGRLEAWWDGDNACVEMVPEAPDWTADRPMRTTLRYDGDTCSVGIVRIPRP